MLALRNLDVGSRLAGFGLLLLFILAIVVPDVVQNHRSRPVRKVVGVMNMVKMQLVNDMLDTNNGADHRHDGDQTRRGVRLDYQRAQN